MSQRERANQGALTSAPPASYPSTTADGQYQAHAALYMPVSMVNSGYVHHRMYPRPSTSMQGGRFSSQNGPMAVQVAARGVAKAGVSRAIAMQDAIASSMAAQLLSYAGHPSFGALTRVQSPLPSEFYEFPSIRQGQCRPTTPPSGSAMQDSNSWTQHSPGYTPSLPAMSPSSAAFSRPKTAQQLQHAPSPSPTATSGYAASKSVAFSTGKGHGSLSPTTSDTISSSVTPNPQGLNCASQLLLECTSDTRLWSGQSMQVMRERAPTTPPVGWMNSMGDMYDVTTGMWVRLPYEAPDEYQLPPTQRAWAWHERHVLAVCLRWWRLGYMQYRQRRVAKVSRSQAYRTRKCLRKAWRGLEAAVEYRYNRNIKVAQAHGHHSVMLLRRGWFGLLEAVECRMAKLRLRRIVRNHMDRVHLQQAWAYWKGWHQRAWDKTAVRSWAARRMSLWRKAVCLGALRQNVLLSKKNCMLYEKATTHRRHVWISRAIEGWRYVLRRSKYRAAQLKRHSIRQAARALYMSFYAWRRELMEARVDALTEQVYDLKRELAYAVAWSD